MMFPVTSYHRWKFGRLENFRVFCSIFKEYKCVPTSEADCLKEGHPSTRSQIEQVLFGVFQDRLALIPVVVHVESLASGVRLASEISETL